MNAKFQRVTGNKNLMYIVVAFVMAALAAFIAMRYVQTQVAERTRDNRAMVQVAVPTADMRAGTPVHSSDLALRSVPADFVPADAVTEATVEQIAGRVLKSDAKGGAPLSAAMLVPVADQFSTIIPEGKVAYNLSVDENNSISGMVAPGDLIDIFFLKDGEGSKGTRIFPLLQQIKVLATGTRLGERVPGRDGASAGDGYSSVTLELDHYQAQQLSVAGKAGSLRVVLRKNNDTSAGVANGLSENDLIRSLGGGAPPDPPVLPTGMARGPVVTVPSEPKGQTVEFIIGRKG